MRGESMIHRCIMIFPKFTNINLIDDIRKQYDPLYHLVRPHVTLVFPFKSNLTRDELREHIESSMKEMGSFKLKLQGISGEDGGYLFLNVVGGSEELLELHNRLYLGILKPYYPEFLLEKSFSPHLTVGRIRNQVELSRVVNEYSSMNVIFEEDVREISVEIIDENENSIIEMTIKN
jgi:2'-5' RNA ligase